jgi:hypothetical protein
MNFAEFTQVPPKNPNYIEHYYIKHYNNITTMHFRLKKGLYNGNNYTINITYDL